MRSRRPTGDETGSVTPMIIGFTLLLLMLGAVVVDASAAYLRRSGLSSVADGAALAGTEAVDTDRSYTSGLGADPRLVEAQARAAVRTYLGDVGAHTRFPGLRVTGVVVTRDEVRVRVEAPLDLPLSLPGMGEGTTVSSTGSSRLTLTG